jgi:tRNA (guanine-N(7)-)-methyltransferase
LRLRNKPWAKDALAAHPEMVIQDPAQWKGRWHERFGNNNPIHIEIGSGKGQFVSGMARQNPNINYIGIEIQESVLVAALEKALAADVPNLQLLHVNGGQVTDYFEDGEVDQIYLNFSDPWPKKRHAKRRLTHESFLVGYEKVLPPFGELHFKTDNRGLFEYSLASFSQFGLVLKQVWLDLHQVEFPGNVMTEYEEKFSAKGHPIYRVEVIFPQDRKAFKQPE